MGAPMYWSGYDGETNIRLVEEAGLTIVSTEQDHRSSSGSSPKKPPDRCASPPAPVTPTPKTVP